MHQEVFLFVFFVKLIDLFLKKKKKIRSRIKKGKTDGRILLKQQKLSIHLPSPQGPSGNPCSIVSPPFISLLAKTSSAFFTSTNSLLLFCSFF